MVPWKRTARDLSWPRWVSVAALRPPSTRLGIHHEEREFHGLRQPIFVGCEWTLMWICQGSAGLPFLVEFLVVNHGQTWMKRRQYGSCVQHLQAAPVSKAAQRAETNWKLKFSQGDPKVAMNELSSGSEGAIVSGIHLPHPLGGEELYSIARVSQSHDSKKTGFWDCQINFGGKEKDRHFARPDTGKMLRERSLTWIVIIYYGRLVNMGDPQPSKAPLSGILFAIEELSHVSSRLTTRVICVILIGSIVPRKMSVST